jgi:hypothetical protein
MDLRYAKQIATVEIFVIPPAGWRQFRASEIDALSAGG